jgi:hypothetical protein
MKRGDDEILGGLPRSRPGRRSQRRAEGPGARGGAPGRAAGPGAAAQDPGAAGAPPEGPGGARTPPEESGPPLATDADLEATAGGDPLSGAVRAAANVARTGVRAAGGVANGVLQRLSRRR